MLFSGFRGQCLVVPLAAVWRAGPMSVGFSTGPAGLESFAHAIALMLIRSPCSCRSLFEVLVDRGDAGHAVCGDAVTGHVAGLRMSERKIPAGVYAHVARRRHPPIHDGNASASCEGHDDSSHWFLLCLSMVLRMYG